MLERAGGLAAHRPGLAVGHPGTVEERPASQRSLDRPDALPFHNEGLYLREPPHFLMLLCEAAPAEGGETLLLPGGAALAALASPMRDRLRMQRLRLRVGDFAWPRRLVVRHPDDGEELLQFCDPAIAADCALETLDGQPATEQVDAVRAALGRVAPITHRWTRGDLLLVDNHRLMHARRAWTGPRRLHRLLVGPHADRLGQA